MLKPPTQKTENEEKKPTRKIRTYKKSNRARLFFYSRKLFGGNTMSIHTRHHDQLTLSGIFEKAAIEA